MEPSGLLNSHQWIYIIDRVTSPPPPPPQKKGWLYSRQNNLLIVFFLALSNIYLLQFFFEEVIRNNQLSRFQLSRQLKETWWVNCFDIFHLELIDVLVFSEQVRFCRYNSTKFPQSGKGHSSDYFKAGIRF